MTEQVQTRTDYDHQAIEAYWREKWETDRLYRSEIDRSRPKHYALTMLPYPSGDLHIGHWYAMAPSDARARYMRMKGFNVLFPMGFDAFGLPAENAAIKRQLHPKTWTYGNIESMRKQMKLMGASFDWEREAVTCDPEYYKWTQWFFLKFYENGLAYKKLSPVDFCPSCNTTLAREQVIGDERVCERCGTPVIKKELDQWFFKITEYAEELLDYSKMDWPERVEIMQENWIGRSEGAYVTFLTEDEDPIEIFTTRPDTLWGATFMVLAPEHPLVEKLTSAEQADTVAHYIDEAGRKSEIDRTAEGKEKTGVFTGGYAINPVNGERIPVWIADYVLMGYGTGAIMAVPAHDQRDFEFARQFGLKIIPVIQPEGEELDGDTMETAHSGEGVMINSGKFNGTVSNNEKGTKNPSIKAVIDHLEANSIGNMGINYRLRDWLISRQRYWGSPIPIVYCDECGPQPVPYDQLPVELPDDIQFMPTGESPLRSHEGFLNTTCPNCGGHATRETDTMDTFMCSSWYQFRYLSPHDDDYAFTPEEGAYWLPVDQYTGGIEHATMHLLYTRYFSKAMRDCGVFDPTIDVMKEQGASEEEIERIFNEPMVALVNQGTILGEPQDGHIVAVNGEYEGHALVAKLIAVIGDAGEATSIPKQGLERAVGEVIKRTEDTITIETEEGHNITVQVGADTDFDISGSGPNAGLQQIKYRLGIEKMSKSKGNVVAPDELVREYGADTVRAYLMFAFRWEKGGPWDSQGVQGVIRWMQDVWNLVKKGAPQAKGDTQAGDRDLARKTHQSLAKVEESMETFSFNTAVAGLMELKNAIQAAKNVSEEAWREAIKNMLLMMAPITPYVAEELWAYMGYEYSVHHQDYPVYDPEVAAEDEVTMVVQINGKVRDKIQVAADISEDDAKATALASDNVQRHLDGKEPKKIIYIAPRNMINIVV